MAAAMVSTAAIQFTAKVSEGRGVQLWLGGADSIRLYWVEARPAAGRSLFLKCESKLVVKLWQLRLKNHDYSEADLIDAGFRFEKSTLSM